MRLTLFTTAVQAGLLGIQFLQLIIIFPIIGASATISFYDPTNPPDLATGNWTTSVSKPCREALMQPIESCSPLLFRLLEGGSTFMNTYYPRPQLTNETLSEVCTPQCRSELEQWVENQHDKCTSEDDSINYDDGWGGSQNLYQRPDFMMRYYWNWCLRDLDTNEFCLPTRAQYEGLPTKRACATEEVLTHICDDSCLKQALAFFSSIGQLGFASDTYDYGKNSDKIPVPKVEELCPSVNLTSDIEFTYSPRYRNNGDVCDGEIVSELYTVEPPNEPDIPYGVTVWDGDDENDGSDPNSDTTEDTLDGETKNSDHDEVDSNDSGVAGTDTINDQEMSDTNSGAQQTLTDPRLLQVFFVVVVATVLILSPHHPI